jgi:hypothetical protein
MRGYILFPWDLIEVLELCRDVEILEMASIVANQG